MGRRADNAKQIDELVAARKGEATPKPNHVRHILIKVAPEATADEKGVALSKLSEAAARIKNGESFAEVARAVSHDTGSASRGGDVGDDMSMMVTPFRKAGDALKPGETSPAVETMFGYHLLTKDDPSKSSEVEAAVKKSVTRELFYRVKGVEAAKELASKIHASMKEGKDAEEAIRAAIAPLKRTGTSAPALFLVRDPGEEATPPAPESNDEADAGASSTTTTSAAAHGADAGAPNKPAPPPVIAKDATPETDPDRPKLEASSAFNRGGQPLPSLSPDSAQKVLAFSFEAKAGELMPEPLRTDDSFVIVRLKEQKSATKEEFEKERETYLQTLLAAKQAEALALYVRRLRDAAKSEIKIEQTYLVDPASRDGGVPGEDEEF